MNVFCIPSNLSFILGESHPSRHLPHVQFPASFGVPGALMLIMKTVLGTVYLWDGGRGNVIRTKADTGKPLHGVLTFPRSTPIDGPCMGRRRFGVDPRTSKHGF